MISSAILHTLCFPWMLVSSTGELIDAQDGTLFKLSARARTSSSIEYCLSVRLGWSQCPMGYAVYCRKLQVLSGAKLVLHGLKVPGVSTVVGKSETLSIKTEKSDIESYITKNLSAFAKI